MAIASPSRYHIITLGCSKNRVDSDGMDALLQQRGMTASDSRGRCRRRHRQHMRISGRGA